MVVVSHYLRRISHANRRAFHIVSTVRRFVMPAKINASTKARSDTMSEAAAGDISAGWYWYILDGKKPAEARTKMEAT